LRSALIGAHNEQNAADFGQRTSRWKQKKGERF
jgi:hypothetical protein